MILADTYIFRIIHIDNLDYILRAGNLTNKFSEDANPDYVGIGETELIGKREDTTITTTDGGKEFNPSADYLPFYFHFKSVMLYSIQNGYRVKLRPAKDIIYLVYKLDEIIDEIEYLFTDGHGYTYISNWYEDINNLSLLDIADIRRVHWKNTDLDPDRRRRKQAEFWIKQPLALNLITGIATYEDATNTKVKDMCEYYHKEIDVKTKPNFYY
ncbi:type II toxin-antitoxin system toxin DNA ADP-ribosyl transferase DarT [Mesonia sp.]|uniref:type II toxin-antitoxin system toxin DNA ADP-ribosyl transferase DarT n=1 Tax=Mesonia sp. TaxID=1960830 RepID=UPI003F986BA3